MSHQELRDRVNSRIGCNVYGRIESFLRFLEDGEDKKARQELSALMTFFERIKS